MKCTKCGAEIQDDVMICPYCEMPVGQEAIVTEKEQIPAVIDRSEVVTNELIGKKYSLVSTKYMCGSLSGRIVSTVEVAEDRLKIDIKPKKKNVSPVILLEDLLSVELSKKICPLFIAMAVMFVITGFASPLFFLLAALSIFVGINTKITITQRNGIAVIMYSRDKASAERFKEDMKKIAKIG